jgi:hypothetical protein
MINNFTFESGSLTLNFPLYYPKIAVISKKKHFSVYREALVDSLKKCGYLVESVEYPDQISNDTKVVLIVNPIQFSDFKFKKKVSYYAIQTEQLISNTEYSIDSGFFNYLKIFLLLKKFNSFFDWSPGNVELMKKFHKNYFYFPFSTFPELKYKLPSQKEIYDIAFIGWDKGIDSRRKIILENIQSRYKIFPKFNNIWGEEKTLAILQSKILLNLHFDHSLAFESPRFFEYLYNKKFLLSENISNSYPFVENIDYASFNFKNIYEKIDFFLANQEEREKFILNGYLKSISNSMEINISIITNRISLDNVNVTPKRKLKNFIVFNIRNTLIKRFLYISILLYFKLRFLFGIKK